MSPVSMPKKAPVKTVESVSVKEFYNSCQESLKLNIVAGKEGLNRRIRDKTLNRPALALTGNLKYFGFKRVQLFGAGEMGYLRDLKKEKQRAVLKAMLLKDVPCLLITRNLAPSKHLVAIAEEKGIPLLRTPMNTGVAASTTTSFLEKHFAPSTKVHGTMMDVKGIGTLIRGDSGIGKSECALGLIDRGHSLVADDVVNVRLVNEQDLIASGSELNRGYMECRGIGIICITDLFGIRAIRLEMKIDLVVTFIEWIPGMEEERTGLEESFIDILGHPVSHVVMPVRSGRDLAQLVEVAAMIKALKLAGHHSAKNFNEQLIKLMSKS